MTSLELKSRLVLAGSVLAAGVMSRVQGSLPLDPQIVSDQTQALNTEEYQLAQIFSKGLANALDPTNPNRWDLGVWVEKLDQGNPTAPGGPLFQLAQLALGGVQSGSLQSTIQQLLAGVLAKVGTGALQQLGAPAPSSPSLTPPATAKP